MNHIYRLVWNSTHRVWMVASELSHTHKKTKTICSVAVFLGGISTLSIAETKSITLPANGTTYSLQSNNGSNGVDSADGLNGSDGSSSYEFTSSSSKPTDNLISATGVTVIGGAGGSGAEAMSNGTTSGNGGAGGNAISTSIATILNSSGTLKGGKGGDAGGGYGSNLIIGSAGTGGSAISGNHLVITNSTDGVLAGGDGGKGGDVMGSPVTGGSGGSGGAAVLGNNLSIVTYGAINGGVGGAGGDGGIDVLGWGFNGPGDGGEGASGGAGISGYSLNIINSGTITGGNGGNGGSGSTTTTSKVSKGGNGGIGGDAIVGGSLTIVNSGTIVAGSGGDAGAGNDGTHGTSGASGAAVRFTSGTNSLTLKSGSVITGDIILSATDADTTNTLLISSDDATTVTGNLTASAYTGVALSGKTLTLSGKASFAENTSLTFGNPTGDAVLNADSVSLDSTTTLRGNITDWQQNSYTLLTTTTGISGFTSGNVTNELLTEGATDYAQMSLSDDGNSLFYGLKWNNTAANGYGTFDLKDGAVLTLGTALSDNISGADGLWDGKSLTKAGLGSMILTGKNTYSGTTTVSAGILKTGVEDAFANTSGVTVSDGATLNLGGNSQHINAGVGTLTNSGTVLINDAGADVLAKVVTLYGDMINSGLVVINNGPTNAGQTLAVNGDWTGNGGTVSLGTVLGGDDSLTDKLAISGNASGTTYVSVANEGGTGAQTLEGIELISTGSSTADAFVQSGRVVAGSYEYHLQKGSASGANMNNWYLTSQNQNAQTYRPERGSYASNLQAAATMFSMRLKDRQGGSVYTDPVTDERHESSLWVRSVGGHTEGRLSDGQSKYSANRMVFQLGGDVLNGSLGADDAWHLGLMGGYGKQYSNTHNNLSGYNSKGSVWGYSTGIYGTWYQNAKDKTGLYADSWLAWNWFDNSVKGDELSYEKYKSKGLTASLETGYVFHTGSYVTSGGMENNVYVTPQAQVLWSGVKADNHTEANGTTVEGRGSDNIQTRLGVRLSITGQSRLDKDSVRQFEPFVEANWVYTAKDYGVKMGDSSAYLQGSRNVAELKTGVEGRVSENLSVWGSVAQQLGGNSYQDTQGMLGVKYAF